MKSPNLIAYILLVLLTFVTVMASNTPVILISMALKFLIIAHSFMDLKVAHPAYKIGCVLYIGAASLIFSALL